MLGHRHFRVKILVLTFQGDVRAPTFQGEGWGTNISGRRLGHRHFSEKVGAQTFQGEGWGTKISG